MIDIYWLSANSMPYLIEIPNVEHIYIVSVSLSFAQIEETDILDPLARKSPVKVFSVALQTKPVKLYC